MATAGKKASINTKASTNTNTRVLVAMIRLNEGAALANASIAVWAASGWKFCAQVGREWRVGSVSCS